MPDRGTVGEEVDLSRVRKNDKEMEFVSLHHHSTYSFLDGYGHPAQHVARAAELGMPSIALTEHGNMSSHPKLEQAARDLEIHPVYGCELYTGKAQQRRKNHLSAWAMNEDGYRNLLRMLTWAWSEGFYFEPTVGGSTFVDYSDDIIVGSGCTGSLLATSLVGGKNIDPADASFERGLSVAARFRDLLGDRYYLEVQQFPELAETTCRINPLLEQISRKLRIPLVATADVHYCLPEQNQMQTILHAVRPGSRKTFEEQARSWGYDVLLTHPTRDQDVIKRLRATGLSRKAAGEAVAATREIAERCQVILPKAAPLRYPSEVGSRTLFRRWLKDGWGYRDIQSRPDPQMYAERLEYEVSIIEQKDFVDYFLIVSEMTRWAKDHGIFVGPARGSAAASLVCYLLRITEVDPLIFPDLVFERFIDITRVDIPDIDLDFDDQRRHEVLEHLAEKYGEDRVTQLGTFSTYKAKMALDDVARVYQIPKWEVEKVKDLLLVRSSGDLRASATIEDTVEMFDEAGAVFKEFPDLWQSTKIEGMVKGMGKHAAGAIVASTPITETCAVYGDKTAIDKYDAEYMNLLKIDNLGLANCGMLAEAAAMLGEDITFFYDIPLDDEVTMRGFQENDLVGIFQFDGRAMRIVNNALHPDNFYEVCVVNALARPGPLHNNATMHYVDIKHGRAEPEMRHPLFDAIVANTQYQVVYQEQILRIVREIGGFDWTHAAYIRKIISRKIGEQEFQKSWKTFAKGAKERGVPTDVAKKIWGMCITAGSYAFNAAHSVSYGMLGFWTMWLKQHHPLIFYTAALRRLPEQKHLELMRDAVRHGIMIKHPTPNSGVSWEIAGENAIQAGLITIPGIGEKMAATIVESGPFNDWEDLINVKGIGVKSIQNILNWVYQEDPLGVRVLDRKLEQMKEAIKDGKLKDGDGRRLPVPTHTVATVPYGYGQDTLVVWIGVVTNINLRDLFEVNYSRTGIQLDPNSVKDPDLREWVLMNGTDGDDVLTLKVDRWTYPKMREVIWKLKKGRDIVLVKGVKIGRLPHKAVHVDRLLVLE